MDGIPGYDFNAVGYLDAARESAVTEFHSLA